MGEDWLVRIVARLRAEAAAECGRCQGRAHGDCDPACIHWPLTATQSDRLAEVGQSWRRRLRRGPRRAERLFWSGPVRHGEETDMAMEDEP